MDSTSLIKLNLLEDVRERLEIKLFRTLADTGECVCYCVEFTVGKSKKWAQLFRICNLIIAKLIALRWLIIWWRLFPSIDLITKFNMKVIEYLYIQYVISRCRTVYREQKWEKQRHSFVRLSFLFRRSYIKQWTKIEGCVDVGGGMLFPLLIFCLHKLQLTLI